MRLNLDTDRCTTAAADATSKEIARRLRNIEKPMSTMPDGTAMDVAQFVALIADE